MKKNDRFRTIYYYEMLSKLVGIKPRSVRQQFGRKNFSVLNPDDIKEYLHNNKQFNDK